MNAKKPEENKIFTVKMSGGMRFYRLRSTGETKLKVTSIRLQDNNAVIAYEILEEQSGFSIRLAKRQVWFSLTVRQS